MHCSVLQYCDTVSHLVCIFVPQEPEVLRLDHTHFPGSSPESELEEPDFSPSEDSLSVFCWLTHGTALGHLGRSQVILSCPGRWFHLR